MSRTFGGKGIDTRTSRSLSGSRSRSRRPVYPEVVGVDGAEERVVGVRVVRACGLQRIEPGPRGGGRELEAVGRQVAVGAGAPVAAELLEVAVVEGGGRGLPHRTACSPQLSCVAGFGLGFC